MWCCRLVEELAPRQLWIFPLLTSSLHHPEETLIRALRRRGPESLHSLTAVSNNAGAEGRGGLALLTEAGQVDRMIMSFLGPNKKLERQYLTGKIAIELCPQGTLAERIRAAGSGIPAFFTPTGGRKLHCCLSPGSLLATDGTCRHFRPRRRNPSSFRRRWQRGGVWKAT